MMIAVSPKFQARILPELIAAGVAVMPVIYGGMIGRADAAFPGLAAELRRIVPKNTEYACIDWERMTWVNQFGAGGDAETIERGVVETQIALLDMCRGMRSDVKRWGCFNTPRCWYRADGKQPDIDPRLLAAVDVFGPSWYGLDADVRYQSLARCNLLDAEKSIVPWIKPDDSAPTLKRYVVWHQIDTSKRAESFIRKMTRASA